MGGLRIISSVLAIFTVLAAAVIIGFGYLSLFSSLVGSLPFLPGFFTFVVIVVIFLSFRYAGIEFDLIRQRRLKQGSVGRFVFYYVLLFFLSASGLLRFGMYYFEGPVIAKELASKLIGNFNDFTAKEDVIFGTPKWDQFEKSARSDFAKIKADMNNSVGGYCGVGPVVRPEIDALHKKLDGFRFLSGSDSSELHSCKNTKLLADTISNYESMFEDALKNSAVLSEDKVKEKQSAKETLDALVSDNRAILNSLLDRLEKAGSFLFDPSLHDDAIAALRKANTNYSELLGKAKSSANQTADALPAAVNVDELRDVGSPTAVYLSVIKRFFSARTLLFAAASLGLDIILIFILANARALLAGSHRNFSSGRRGVISGTEVEYLWVPDAGLPEK